MKDPFDWNGEDPRVFQGDDWPDDDYDAEAEDGYDGFYSHDCMEEDEQEEYPEDGF